MMIPIPGLYQCLLDSYGKQNWWPADSAYEMLVGAILTQNTHWSNADKALAQIRQYCGGSIVPSPILAMPETELAQLLRPSGYYNQKATRVKQLTKWFAQYHFDVRLVKRLDATQLRAELLALPGVGRETADCMLVYAFDKPFFIIDAYTRRLFTRLGFNVPRAYDDFSAEIERQLPKELALFNEYHALIVKHNTCFCQSKPRCDACPLVKRCDYHQQSTLIGSCQ